MTSKETKAVPDRRPMTIREWTFAVICGACVLAGTADRLLAAADPLDGSTSISASLVMSIVVWIVGAVLTYGAVNARLSVIESKQKDSDSRLERIEDKLDLVLERRRHERS